MFDLIPNGLLFGLLDNGVLIAFAFKGMTMDDVLLARFPTLLGAERGIGAVLGGAVGNTISDGIGAVVDPYTRAAVLGIILGCILPMLVIPLITKYRARRA